MTYEELDFIYFILFIHMHNDKNRIIFRNAKANICAGEEKKPKELI